MRRREEVRMFQRNLQERRSGGFTSTIIYFLSSRPTSNHLSILTFPLLGSRLVSRSYIRLIGCLYPHPDTLMFVTVHVSMERAIIEPGCQAARQETIDPPSLCFNRRGGHLGGNGEAVRAGLTIGYSVPEPILRAVGRLAVMVVYMHVGTVPTCITPSSLPR